MNVNITINNINKHIHVCKKGENICTRKLTGQSILKKERKNKQVQVT